MKIAVLSDLHIGNGDATDRFEHQDTSFLRFLDHLEHNFERIILLGDVYETLSGSRYGDQAKELRRCQQAHSRIAERFQNDHYTYIYGNHDLIASSLEGAKSDLILEIDGKRLWFTHGHIFDSFSHTHKGISEPAFWLVSWLMRLGFRALIRQLDRLDVLLNGASQDATQCKFQRTAIEAARLESIDIVITGHTHIGHCHDHGDISFMNSGACNWGRYSFLAMDTSTDQYRLVEDWS